MELMRIVGNRLWGQPLELSVAQPLWQFGTAYQSLKFVRRRTQLSGILTLAPQRCRRHHLKQLFTSTLWIMIEGGCSAAKMVAVIAFYYSTTIEPVTVIAVAGPR